MNSFLLWCGALLAAALAALFTVPQFVDWNLYRGQFELEASRVLGREVRVAGSVSVTILPTPRMSLGRVRIADVPLDPAEPPGEPILRADRIELGLGISGLLRGALEVQDVTIVAPSLRLVLGADGRGNWQTLALQQGALPIDAREMTVSSVAVSGGTVAVTSFDGKDLLTLKGIDGDVEAGGGGPLRFRGHLDWRGERNELRLSASDGEPGVLRLKASLRGLGSGTALSFDGALSDLARVPKIAGDLTVRLAQSVGAAPPTAKAEGAARAAGPAFELKGRVEGDGRGARLENLSFSFERDGQPQLMTGAVDAAWSSGLDVKAQLQSKWLDVDRVAPVAPRSGEAGAAPPVLRPVDLATTMIRSLDALLPDQGRFAARLQVDQVTLGGEAISGVALALSGRDGQLTIESLEAGLPGGGHLRLSGTANADATAFDGRVLVRAASGGRLMTWAARGTELASLDIDAAFVADARLRWDGGELAVDALNAEIGGQAVSGRITHRTIPKVQTTLSLSAAQLDLSTLLPAGIDAGQAITLLKGQPIGEALSGSAALRSLDRLGGDVTLLVRAGRLTAGPSRFADVDADVTTSADGLSIRRLRFQAGDGIAVDIAGDTSRGFAVAPQGRGSVSWFVTASESTGVRRILDLLATAVPNRSAFDSAGTLPVRLAGTYTIPAAADAGGDLTLDGTIGRTKFNVVARTGRQIEAWRTHVIEADVTLDGRDALALAGLAGSGRSGDDTQGASRVTVRLAGVPATGVLTKLSARRTGSDAGSVDFDGRVIAGANGVEVNGLALVDLKDGTELARLAGLPFARSLRDVPIQGTLGVAYAEAQITLALDRVGIAGTRVSGAMTRMADGRFEAGLVTDRLVLRELLAAITMPAAAGAADAGGPWSDAAFDLAGLSRLAGTATLSTPRLEIDRGAALQDARLDVTLAGGRVDVAALAGTVLEGRMTAAFSMTPGAGDMTLDGKVEVADADLGALGLGRQAARGLVSGRIAFQSRAASPRALVQYAKGRGSLDLGALQLPGLNPAAVQRAAQSFLAADALLPDGKLQALVKASLSQGMLAVPARALPVEIENGVLRLGRLAVEAPDALMVNRTTVDLVTMKADSEWRAEPRVRDVGTKRKEALPAVSIVQTGPVWDFARLEPQVRADDLARELTVRLMERDVEELERLRKIDEQRAREEAERRQAFEQAQAAASAAQAAAAVAAGTGAQSPVGATTATGAIAPAEGAAEPAPQPSPKPALRYPQRPSEPSWWGLQYVQPGR